MVVDKNNVVLGGNQRLTALTKIQGYKEHDLKAVLSLTKEYQSMTDKLKQDITSYWLTWIDKPEVEVIDASMLSPEKQAEFIAKDNLSYGEWDPVKLAQLFDVDQLSEWGFDGDIFKEVKKQHIEITRICQKSMLILFTRWKTKIPLIIKYMCVENLQHLTNWYSRLFKSA